MKILVLTPYLPHPLSGHGGGEYVYGLIKHLSKSHEVMLISFGDGEELTLSKELQHLPVQLKIVPREKGKQKNMLRNARLVFIRLFQFLRSVVLWQPYYVSKFRNPRMEKLISQETRNTKYDIIQIEFAQMGQYVQFVSNGRSVIREHDVMFRPSYRRFRKANSLLLKLFYYLEWCRWANYERKMVRHFDHVLTFTQQDTDLLKRLTNSHNVSYNPRGIEIPEVVRDYSQRDRFSLLFVGTFNHLPNVDAVIWLCSEIFPELQKRCPQATLYIVGKNPPTSVRTIAAADQAIRLLGFVPQIEDYLDRLSVFVAPIRLGGGIKTKILHAQSYGIPVVTTPIGAEGIESGDETTLIVKRSVPEIVDSIVMLFANREKAAEIANKARIAVVRHYAWATVVKQLEGIYSKLLENPPSKNVNQS